MKSTHRPILPQGEENDSDLRRIWYFLRQAFLYIIRHLTIGTAIRLRRHYIKWRGKKYFI